jgi:outer membrane protein
MEADMRTSCSTRAAPAVAALLAAATPAFAQKAGDFVLGAGAAVIMPRESIGTLSSSGPAAAPFNAATAGATASIDPVSTVTVSALYMVTDHFAGELTIGVPPKFKVDVGLRSGSHPDAASARVSIPALLGKYLFLDPGSRWRPYVGLGVTHASFSSVRANLSDPVIAGVAGTSASLGSSWAPVYNAGVIYNVTDRWSVNASLAYIPLESDVTFVGSGTTTRGTLKLDPVDLVARVGYRF